MSTSENKRWHVVHALACRSAALGVHRGNAPSRGLRARFLVALLLACLTGAARAAEQAGKPTVIVVIGAAGEPEYGADFVKAADAWTETCKRANVNYVEIGRGSREPAAGEAGTDRQRFQDALAAQAKGQEPLWIVLIGHGTFDGKEAKFNLTGPDFSDAELVSWLKPITRPVALLNCSSASGPFLTKVSAPGRVVITAAQSGAEVNYSRFGMFMAQAIADPAADIDRDGQTSLLEAFLAASRKTADFYQSNGRLATEHALLDDNGDGLGVSAEWFDGTRATRAARNGAPVDGVRAGQWFLVPSPQEAALSPEMRTQRDALELKIEALRQRKSRLAEADYYQQLDELLVTLARLQSGGK
jgi:hypothetical protein